MGLYVKPMERQELLSFLFGRGRKSYVFYECIWEVIFYLRILLMVSGIENYPSACMSCCSDDLALLLPHQDFWSLRSKNIQSENKLSPLVV